MCMEQAPICPQKANSYCQTHGQRRAALSLDIFLPTPFLISVVPCVLKNILTQLLLPVPSLMVRMFFLKQALTLVFKKRKCQHLFSFRAAPKIIFYFTLGKTKKCLCPNCPQKCGKYFDSWKQKGERQLRFRHILGVHAPPLWTTWCQHSKPKWRSNLQEEKSRAKPI